MKALLKVNLLYIFLLFIIWRLLTLISSQISVFFISQKDEFTGKLFSFNNLLPNLWTFANFDGEHYLCISQYGYRQFENVFFPGYPFLTRFVALFLKDHLLSAILISNLCLLVLLFFLYKLFLLDFKKEAVYKGLILFLAFPSSFFLGFVYSESLFLLLVTLSFYFARRNKLFLASFFGGLSSLTRLVGIFTIFSTYLIWKEVNKKKKTLFLLSIIVSSFGVILFFNWKFSGDPFSFLNSQSLVSTNRTTTEIILLPQVIFRYLKIFVTADFSYNYTIALQEFFLTLVFLLVIVKNFKKMRKEYLFYSLFVVILPTLTGTLSSMPRYLLAAFPLYFYGATSIKSRFLFAIIVIMFMLIQLINTAFFVSGYWVS